MNHYTLLLFGASCMLLPVAHAAPLNNASGLAAPEQTLDFEGVTLERNSSITDQFVAQGVRFSVAFWNPDPSETYRNMVGNRLGNFDSSRTQGGLFTMTFTAPLSSVAFALVSAPGSSTFTALRNGAAVESFTHLTAVDDPVNFYGFQNIVFDRVTISTESFNHTFMLDSLQTVSAVPEPGTLALFLAGAGLVVATAARRRRR